MTSSPSLVHRIQHWAQERPHRAALHGKRDGRWISLTWDQYWANVRAIGKTLISLGLEPKECVAMIGANRVEFVQYQFGIEAARGVPAPIYGTSTTEQVAYIITDAAARVVVIDSDDQLGKILEAEKRGLIKGIEHILSFDELETEDDRVIFFDEVLEGGNEEPDGPLEERLSALNGEHIAQMIYTSGTSGQPKGVEITHGGQLYIGQSLQNWVPIFMSGEAEYHAISYLPLSHQAEQLVTNVSSLMVGGQTYFCDDIKSIKDYLVDVRPTVFLGVPRVWEKFEAALRARLAEAEGVKGKLADWAMETELACFREQLSRGVSAREHMPLKRRIARKLVIDKIRNALGLDRLEVAFTGSAPIAVRTQEFFASLGIGISEAYGLTETSGLSSVTDRLTPAFGTVGKVFPGMEVRIAEEGEIQLKGPNCQTTYRGLPEQTAELFTEDGWMRTGDQGSLDADGNIRITGRLKEIIITAGAKNVAPVELEQYMESVVGVGQTVVVGDRQPYLCALVTLDPENLGPLAEAAGVAEASMAELARSEKVIAHIEAQINEHCNAKVARYQTIKKIAVLPQELSIEAGELTPSMKLRRKQISENYAATIDAFYEGGTANTPVHA